MSETMRPRLLDLFCGAGGAAMGYHRAGFDVIGIDNRPQPRFPFAFVQADALNPPVDLADFDAIHTSPPCQAYSFGTRRWGTEGRPDLVASVRQMLRGLSRPYIIENVPGSPLLEPLVLEGHLFGLRLIRRRHFEVNWPAKRVVLPKRVGSVKAGDYVTVAGQGGDGSNRYADWCEAMGIDWMTKQELSQAVPPAYTEFIGRQLLALGDRPA